MRLLLFCLALQFTSYSQDKDNTWQIKKYENGIAVYSRKTVDSDFRELKSVVYIKTSLNSIVALINDRETYPQWVYKCSECRILKKVSDTELIHYQTVEAPWPATDRDFVVNIKISQNETTKVVTITSTSTPYYIPEKPNRVRITKISARWDLVPFKDGLVQVNYQLFVHPGGYVPAWLVNMAAIDGPYETMVNFKQLVFKEKYQQAKSALIKELNE